MKNKGNFNIENEEFLTVSDDADIEFDDEFLDYEQNKHPVKHGKKKWNPHMIFFIVVACLFLLAFVRLMIWNRGQKSDYDPTEDTSEFDTEPLDYIQPLTSNQLDGKPKDDTTTIFVLGNAPFADQGDNNFLCNAISKTMNATVINASFADSYTSITYEDNNPVDKISLYEVTKALVTNDTSAIEASAANISDESLNKAKQLSKMDLSQADALFIMYDLNDYIDHRPVYDPNDTGNLHTVYGAIEASVKLIQEKYPYIRIVLLSTPASGKTIDDFYVDGNIQDLGNGTLVDYLGHTANVAMSNGISFIDTYFGVINVETREQYLENDYHINEAGAQAIADRIQKLITLDE